MGPLADQVLQANLALPMYELVIFWGLTQRPLTRAGFVAQTFSTQAWYLCLLRVMIARLNSAH
jgi:hypothetical protein